MGSYLDEPQLWVHWSNDPFSYNDLQVILVKFHGMLMSLTSRDRSR